MKLSILTTLILISFSSFSQKVVKDTTLTIEGEYWIEPIDDEINQRIKFKKLKELFVKKRNIDINIDSLFNQLQTLEKQKDSLQIIIAHGHTDIIEDCQFELNEKTKLLNETLLIINKLRKQKVNLIKTIIILVALDVLVLVIIL